MTWSALGVGLAIAGFSWSAAALPPERNWDLDLDIYGWVTATDLETSGTWKGHLDKDIDDAFTDWDGGGGGDIAFRYDRFVGLLDGAWVQSDYKGDGWLSNTIVDFKLGYRVLDVETPWWHDTSVHKVPHVNLDLMIGARYRDMDSNYSVATPVGFTKQDYDHGWVDGVLGIGTSVGLLPWLSFSLTADVGGFGIGNSSKLTWSVNPRLNFQVFDHFNVFAGYRYLEDERHGDSEIALGGPQVGIGYSF